MATTTQTFRPEQIADGLGMSGKVVRAYLRRTYPRPIGAKGTTWVLSAEQADETITHFKSLRSNDAPQS